MHKQTYDVLMDVTINNKVHRKGGTVELTDKQARYHRLANKLALKAATPEPAAKPRAESKTSKTKKEVDHA